MPLNITLATPIAVALTTAISPARGWMYGARMPGDRWSEWFWTAFDPASSFEIKRAYGMAAVELGDEHATVRWSPEREIFTYSPSAGDFVWGGAVGAALHVGTMLGAVVVMSDNEFPMTLQEDHRFLRPVMFGPTYLVTGKPTRRTRSTLWTTTTIVDESSGQTVADSTSVNQLVEQNNR